TCALLQGGSVSCWGNSNTGIEQLVPAPVAGLSGVTALSSGYGHHCAVLSAGGVRCWGDNNDGQLGNGSQTDAASPVVVSGIANAVAVAAGSRHSCALLADGGVRCWGYRGISTGFGTVRSGLMGDGGTGVTPALTPVTETGIGTAVAQVTGSAHTCALLQDASVWCWGAKGHARGQTDSNDVALAPVQVVVTGAVNALALGDDHTCVSLASGGVQCLGSGFQGQLGTGGQSNEQNPNPSPYPAFSITPLSVLFP
ncbi:MAG: RCC1 domain-containing protein, partial [Hydrogenophaga sp.]|uniref:RCC1 domain-containing protein n=1 Tax=Hydrogenophaga sp. TaxID=1904254 RepID=UPI003D9B000F